MRTVGWAMDDRQGGEGKHPSDVSWYAHIIGQKEIRTCPDHLSNLEMPKDL